MFCVKITCFTKKYNKMRHKSHRSIFILHLALHLALGWIRIDNVHKKTIKMVKRLLSLYCPFVYLCDCLWHIVVLWDDLPHLIRNYHFESDTFLEIFSSFFSFWSKISIRLEYTQLLFDCKNILKLYRIQIDERKMTSIKETLIFCSMPTIIIINFFLNLFCQIWKSWDALPQSNYNLADWYERGWFWKKIIK